MKCPGPKAECFGAHTTLRKTHKQMSTTATRELTWTSVLLRPQSWARLACRFPLGHLMEDQDVRGRSMEMAMPVLYRGRVGRVSDGVSIVSPKLFLSILTLPEAHR